MKRDAEATKRRILDAATAEFAQYGIAGARVDRVATNAQCNKAMIYAYFTSKDGLFDAVFDAVVVRNMRDVPVVGADLADYAARLFDQYQRYPEVARLAAWDRLERGSAGLAIPEVAEANRQKVEGVRQAQRDGHISADVDASALVEIILALVQARANAPEGTDSPEARQRRRDAVRLAVSRLAGAPEQAGAH